MIAEEKLSKRSALPNFMFPPTHLNRPAAPSKCPPGLTFTGNDGSLAEDSSTSAEAVNLTSKSRRSKTPPNFADFKVRINKPALAKPAEIPIMSEPSSNTFESLFLSIPIEIRLKIYLYVISAHPAKHAHLSPSYLYPLSLFPPQGRSEPLALARLTSAPGPSPIFPKKIGYIPSPLLRSCKQIYYESRDLPFESCEFTFVNWFCSGIFASRSFLCGLKEWQTERLRWVGLEALGRDLVGVGTNCGLRGREKVRAEWEEVCEMLHSIWGLRLVIKGRVGGDVVMEETSETSANETALANVNLNNDDNKPDTQWVEDVQHTRIVPVVKNCVLDIENTWVREGLTKLTSLKWLEICIEDDECGTLMKEQFCEQLRNKLGVRVLFVSGNDEVHEGDTPSGTPGEERGS